MRAILLAKATRTSIGGLRASMRPSHVPAGTPLRAAQRATALAPMISKRRRVRSPILDVRPSPENQQAPRGALPLLECPAEPLLAPAGALNRGQPEPSSEIATAPECVGRWGQRRESCGCHSPDPRDGHQPTRDGVLRRMPGDLAIEHSNALVQRSELLDQHGPDPPRRLGQIGGGILEGRNELGGMDRPFGGDHPELSQVTAERVYVLRALTNQQVPRAECDGGGLLVRALEGNEAHGGTLGSLARSASASA